MACWFSVLFLAAVLPLVGDDLKKERPAPDASQQEQAPPEEDTSLAVKEYSFNPLQAQKELQIGNYYFHRGRYRAAANRFREALKWNGGYADAWLRLGQTEDKLKDAKEARTAYAKYVELAPEGKYLAEARKRLEKLK